MADPLEVDRGTWSKSRAGKAFREHAIGVHFIGMEKRMLQNAFSKPLYVTGMIVSNVLCVYIAYTVTMVRLSQRVGQPTVVSCLEERRVGAAYKKAETLAKQGRHLEAAYTLVDLAGVLNSLPEVGGPGENTVSESAGRPSLPELAALQQFQEAGGQSYDHYNLMLATKYPKWRSARSKEAVERARSFSNEWKKSAEHEDEIIKELMKQANDSAQAQVPGKQ